MSAPVQPRERAVAIDREVVALLAERLALSADESADTPDADAAVEAAEDLSVAPGIARALRHIVDAVDGAYLDVRTSKLTSRAGAPAFAALRDTLLGAHDADRDAIMLRFVMDAVEKETGIAGRESDASAVDTSFRDLGLDSLAGVTLRQSTEAAVALKLEEAIVFDQPTPASFAREVLARVVSDAAAASIEQLAPRLTSTDRAKLAHHFESPSSDGVQTA